MILRSETCSKLGCLRHATLGLRVRKLGPQGREEDEGFIIPLCDECHAQASTQPFPIKSTTGFAAADPRKTCQVTRLADAEIPD
jgi:hypothetical protein